MLRVITSDGESYQLHKDVYTQSGTLKNLAEDVGQLGEDIPLPNVDSKTFDRVVQWMEFHTKDVAPWELEWQRDEFLTMEFPVLMQVYMAANYLEVERLQRVCASHIASQIRGKSLGSMRRAIHVNSDFSLEEDAQMMTENKGVYSKLVYSYHG